LEDTIYYKQYEGQKPNSREKPGREKPGDLALEKWNWEDRGEVSRETSENSRERRGSAILDLPKRILEGAL